MSSIFISYRRSDSTPYAVSLAAALRQAFGGQAVFLDTTGIAIGEPYPARLEKELSQARVCIIAIGPDWLRAPDQDGRRRLDDPDDWVHREVRFALERRIAAPVLVNGAALPGAQGLPEGLSQLAFTQAATLSNQSLGQDLRRLVTELSKRFELPLFAENIVWPQPNEEVKAAGALGEDELRTWLTSRRPGSEWVMVPWSRGTDAEDGSALLRNFRFRSFEDAIHFMATASRFVTLKEHHPAWSNVWRTVTVRLTTFDIGHRPSVFDIRLAEYLDELYAQYRPDSATSQGRPSGPKVASSGIEG